MASPAIEITAPFDGARLTNHLVNITGTAPGLEEQWSQDTLEDFVAGTMENVTVNPSGDLALDLGFFENFQDNHLDTTKWCITEEAGGMISSVKDQMYQVSGTSNSTKPWGCRSKMVTMSPVKNSVSAYLLWFCGTSSGTYDSGYATAFGICDDNSSIEVGYLYERQLSPQAGTYIEYRDPGGGYFTGIGGSPTVGPATFQISWNHSYVHLSQDNNSRDVHLSVPFNNPHLYFLTRAKAVGDSISAAWDTVFDERVYSGNFTSSMHDAGYAVPELKKVQWNATRPAGTSLSVAVRSSDSPDMNNSTAWAQASNGQSSDFPTVKRYLQYRVTFIGPDGLITPILHNITVVYDRRPVRQVEVSTDGQLSWLPANGKAFWSATLELPEGTTTVWARVTHLAGDADIANVTVDVDTTPPAGTLLINNGDEFTGRGNVTLRLNASDTYGVASMQLSESPTFGGARWQEYRDSVAFSLTSGDGEKAVYARFRDTSGWESEVVNASIILDTRPPTVTLLINGGARFTNASMVNLALNASDESGIVSMQTGEDAAFKGALWEPYLNQTKWNLSKGDGLKTIHVNVRDAAGNDGKGQATIILDTIPPSSAITTAPFRSKRTNFTVAWNGADNTSGIECYDVQYRVGDGPWVDWLNRTTARDGVFHGKDGLDYYFRVRASDNAGNPENLPEKGSGPFSIRVPVPLTDDMGVELISISLLVLVLIVAVTCVYWYSIRRTIRLR